MEGARQVTQRCAVLICVPLVGDGPFGRAPSLMWGSRPCSCVGRRKECSVPSATSPGTRIGEPGLRIGA